MYLILASDFADGCFCYLVTGKAAQKPHWALSTEETLGQPAALVSRSAAMSEVIQPVFASGYPHCPTACAAASEM